MPKQHCLYCGQEALISREEDTSPASFREMLYTDVSDLLQKNTPVQLYACSACGLVFTPQELENDLRQQDRQEQLQGETGCADADAEREVLEKARELMRNTSWDRALTVMEQRTFPYQSPAEFLVYRSICRLAPLLQSLENGSASGLRYDLLDRFIDNIQKITYYLPADDDEQRYALLTRLFQALLLFGNLPIEYFTPKSMFSSDDLSHYKRTAVLGQFADLLETFQDAPHGTEYLKMGVQLWHSCVKHAFSGYDILTIHMPQEVHQQIETKIKQLNALIKQRDPDYIEQGAVSLWSKYAKGTAVGIASAAIYFLLAEYETILIDLPPDSVFAEILSVFANAVDWLCTFGTGNDYIGFCMSFVYGAAVYVIAIEHKKPTLHNTLEVLVDSFDRR